MKHDRRIHIITVLLFLAVAETGRAQTTNIANALPGRQPGYPMGLPNPRQAKPAATAVTPASTTEVVLHNFASPVRGGGPQAVIRDRAGNFYGTAGGGSLGHGVVFRVDTSGHETVLHTFTGGADGSAPNGVIGDSAGYLYGTTTYGGTSGAGVVFRIDSTGHETVLYSFTGAADGGWPNVDVIGDSAGNLYGTTNGGGASGAGVVYMLDQSGHETVLYTFSGGADGGWSNSSLIRDPAGNLYGTTSYGGALGAGVVYKLDTTGLETVLYSFTGGADGNNPDGGVISDPAGNLYGTTWSGGAAGAGVVFQLSPAGQETVLYSFTGGADGNNPDAGVIRDSAGNLYGVTSNGGTASHGLVYKLNKSGQETVLYAFTNGADGGTPYAGVIRDSAGNLYGTTSGGGPGQQGVVYKVNTSGQETVLYGFPGPLDGQKPDAGVVRDSAGNLYGTTQWGGAAGFGVVYKLDAANRETVLHTFTGGSDGSTPTAGVILDSEGNLYGTTQYGGASNAGIVYKLDRTGQETVLYTFTGGSDGGGPSGVIRDAEGNLYGTAQYGGASNAGVVYKLNPGCHERVLYSFTGGNDGGGPNGVIRDAEGNLYGTAGGGASGAGVVFKLDPARQETVLWSFSWGDGALPNPGLIRDSAGNLYGTTIIGGAAGSGAVFEVSPSGQETTLYSFTGGTDGGIPVGGVIRDAAGNLYGAADEGGAFFAGTVFKLDPSGQETVLYTFTGGADGAYPQGPLIRDTAGNFYGTTYYGGKTGWGVVFKVKP